MYASVFVGRTTVAFCCLSIFLKPGVLAKFTLGIHPEISAVDENES